MHTHSVLVTVTGRDRPGVTSALFSALAAHDVEVLDVEHVVIHGRLVLGVVLTLHGDPGPLRRAVTHAAEALGTEIAVTITESPQAVPSRRPQRHQVAVLGHPLRAGVVGEVARRIADLGGDVDSISRLSRGPVTGLEMVVSGADHVRLSAALVAAAAETGTDIAFERLELRRRPKRLVLLDLDSTILRTDPWAVLAELAGQTLPAARLVAGKRTVPGRDRAEALRARVASLRGLPTSALDEAAARTRCTPGAPGLVSTLRGLGYHCGVVSSGIDGVTERLVDGLGLDFIAANTVEISGGHLTGEIVGDVLDPAGKARALVRFAEAHGVPLSQVVAVGGTAEVVDMLTVAGLGMTFRAADPDRYHSGEGAGRAGLSATGSDSPAPPAPDGRLEALRYVLGLAGDVEVAVHRPPRERRSAGQPAATGRRGAGG